MKMDRKEAERYIKGQLESYLQSKGINTSNPFRCLNPAHNDKIPSMTIDRTSGSGLHCKCFGCGAYYSTLDLIGIDYGLTDTVAIFQKAYELYGIEIEDGDYKTEYQNQPKNERKTQTALHNTAYTTNAETQEEVIKDFTEIVNAAHRELLENPKALEHFQSRGLSMDIIKAYRLGYDAGGYDHFLKKYPEHQTNGKKIGLYQYIFPFPDNEGRYTYFLTEIADRGQVDEWNKKYRKIKKGNTNLAAQLFNERYIQNPPAVIFICEGMYDALSVEQAGGKAIALDGTAANRFIGLCKKYQPATTFILSMDNDEAGEMATEKIKNGLDSLNIPYRIKKAGQGKDFNEALQKDSGAFSEYIQQIIGEVEQEQKAKEEAERQEYLQTSTAYRLQSFIDDIEKSKTAIYYPTGFSNIDGLLDGGLFSGLYVVGAISSLGKTTFCLQIMDNIAAAGHDVIIFSLEMARSELIAKSVSRHSLQADIRKYKTTVHAKTVRGITTGTRYKEYSQKDREIIEAAITDYSEYAHHVYIHEGVGNIGVEQVREAVERHIKITGNKPVILIDYLQILAPYNERATDKQNTDKNVLELKRLSRDFSIPVIGISSFNRDNYTQPVNMAAFKESGAVEYSSDVLIALQYDGMDYQESEDEGKRRKRVRELMRGQAEKAKSGKEQNIQVKVLKNRNGSRSDALLNFYPMFNFFTEPGTSGTAGTNSKETETGTGGAGTRRGTRR